MASLDCLVGCRVSSVVEVERFPSRRSPHSSLVDCTPAFSKLSRSWKLSSIWGRNLSLECSFSTERARDHRIDCATASSEQPKRPPTIFLLNSKPPRRRDEEPEERVASRREDDQNEEVGTSFEQGDYDNLKVEPDHKSGYVALIGKPNVGKSTLLNQLIGQKLSIVTDKPQTTRHRILGIDSGPKHQMILYDTPGVLAKKNKKLDELMMQNVRTATLNADCVLIVVDACKMPEEVASLLEEGATSILERRPTLLVLNKKDLIKPGELAKRIEWYEKYSEADRVIAASAKHGHGVNEVKDWLVSKLPFGPSYYPKDIVSEHPEKFFVGEIVREKILLQYQQEIPYSCQVNVVKYAARKVGKDFIEIEILIERESQKVILLGKDGNAIKLLATAARLDIEEFLGKEVYIEIRVVVKKDWREDEKLLESFGYSGRFRA